jgi:hypothetical protein
MKKPVITTITAIAVSLLLLQASAFSADSGMLWIKRFEPGSADLTDPGIDPHALATLDSLMRDESLEITFLGSADSLAWRLGGRRVHPHVSEAWNDAKRISRARAMRDRYGRGNVGVTHQNVAGVQVIWIRKNQSPPFDLTLGDLRRQNDDLNRQLAELQGQISDLQNRDNDFVYVQDERVFNWGLELGLWAWRAGSENNLVSPLIGMNINVDKTSIVIKGGFTPWTTASEYGNIAESFIELGVKHRRWQFWGTSLSLFRGWEFLTSDDEWTFKTSGIAAGVFYRQGILEFNPAITYSSVETLTRDSSWRLGFNLGVGFHLNRLF